MSGTSAAALNPFPGLRPFREDEEYLFFGREAQVDTMVDRLAAARLLAVVGSSGSGKSSLVNCGLIPALHRGLLAAAGSAWQVAVLRPANRPIAALAEALAAPAVLGAPDADESGFAPADLIEATLRMSKLGLLDAYEMAHPDPRQNLLVVVDQFEELFRYRALANDAAGAAALAASADATAFINLLLEAANQRALPVYVVLTMRSDFLGECAQFLGLPEAVNRGQYLVPRMTRDERRSAISGPVAVAGGQVDPVLLTRLVNDVGDSPDQLSILQHALNRTWAQWQRDGANGPLLPTHYDKIGTMERALDKDADDAFNELTDDRQRKVCETLFRAITDKGGDSRGTRRPTRMDSLACITGATEAELHAVIDVFRHPSRSFLMPPAGQPLTPDTPIDISHESLMRVWQRLRDWVDQEAQSAQTYRRLAETAKLHADGNAALLRPPDLQFALAWLAREQPNADWAARYHAGFQPAVELLKRSEQAFDSETNAAAAQRAEQARLIEQQRRTRRLLLGGLPVIAVLSVALLYANAQRSLAEQQRVIAEAQTKAAVAETQRANGAEREARASQAKAEEALAEARRATAAEQTSASAWEYATRNAPQVRAAVAQAVERQKPVIYLQIADPGQRAAAERLRKQLEGAGYSAPGIEQVKVTPAQPQLRYFRDADKDKAQEIAETLNRWGLTQLRLQWIQGYETATKLSQFEIWLPVENPAAIAALVRQLNAETAGGRKAAGQTLLDRYTASPRAVAEVLATLEPPRVAQLSANGRINALFFLSRTAPLAWDDALQARGSAAVERLRDARSGSVLGPQAATELNRLELLLNAARAGAAEPPELEGFRK